MISLSFSNVSCLISTYIHHAHYHLWLVLFFNIFFNYYFNGKGELGDAHTPQPFQLINSNPQNQQEVKKAQSILQLDFDLESLACYLPNALQPNTKARVLW